MEQPSGAPGVLKGPTHLLPETRSGAPPPAPTRLPPSTSGSRTTPFAFSAELYSSVGSASPPPPQLRPRPGLASLPAPRGSWRSSRAEPSGRSAGGGPKVRERERERSGRRDEPCGRLCSRTEERTDPEPMYEDPRRDVTDIR